MHRFSYKGNQLYCEDTKIADIAQRVDTPFYLYSYQTLMDHYTKLKDAFRGIRPLICFSMKANSNLAVCRVLVRAGAGLDVVSGGELYKARRVGADPRKIVYASVGKTRREIQDALRCGILFFNVESLPELELIDDVASRMKKKASVCIRLNPDVSGDTHSYITTGTKITKFGIDFDTAGRIFRAASNFPNVRINGVHVHIGSQITQAAPFKRAIIRVLKFLKENKLNVKYLNIGGGLGIVYDKERPQTAREFARQILPLIKKSGLKLILEPGRFIAGNSGILVTRVIYVKRGSGKNFVIVDAGMNDLMRPSLYQAHHEIIPVSRRDKQAGRMVKSDIVGPICESGDFLAKDRQMPLLVSGDLLAVMSAGAYGFSMSSNYNSRPRVAEIMVIKGKSCVTKRRESYKDLLRGEAIPKRLR